MRLPVVTLLEILSRMWPVLGADRTFSVEDSDGRRDHTLQAQRSDIFALAALQAAATVTAATTLSGSDTSLSPLASMSVRALLGPIARAGRAAEISY
jgi:hypothetical protein